MMNRSFNFVCAALGLLLLFPVLTVIALVVKCHDGGPVFYAQPRVGKGFRLFRVLKFRSMVVNADQDGLLTAPADHRLTRVGRLLRKHKLDELPQLWNVLTGDMQLVGVRPEVEPYVAMFREQYALLLNQPPGITDPASLAYRREETLFVAERMEQQYVSEILPEKLKLSLDYQRNRSFFSDLRVLLNTVLNLTL
ncbi:MAG TPA: sugar transferase [Candidatus Acidoferrum sp.]|jgi:lipopolysaccharide/colanic/teichoic acid biosynthesis glycosyltransferase|nr:sugar transferase [Candidatus Acidoferrum sp.]